MTRRKIEYLPKKDTPYDTLLDEYEVGMTVADYDELFEGLRVRLVPLLAKIMEAKKNMSIPELPSEMKFSEQAQTRFCQKVSEAMGFDFDYGRMDASTHPFRQDYGKVIPGLLPDLMRKTHFPVSML